MRPAGRIRNLRWQAAMRLLRLRRFLPSYVIGQRNLRLSVLMWVVDRIIP